MTGNHSEMTTVGSVSKDHLPMKTQSNWNSHSPLAGMKMLCKVWHFLKTLNTHLPYNLAILLLGADPREKAHMQRLVPEWHSSFVCNLQNRKTQLAINM